jgi:hypothetical protein
MLGGEVFQLFESEGPRQSGGHVEGDHCGLHQKRATAAHGIEQRRARLPARETENAGGEIFA